ncbi:MAG: DUF2381 family protein [Cystobacter sp.]
MLTRLTAWLLIASTPVSAPAAGQLSSDDCEDTRHLEVAPPLLAPPRICISPGTLTGVIFDRPVTVELEDEVRFLEVTRGRAGIAFIPPRDLRPGETLRLTAAMGMEETSQNLTFVLVAHPGHGSHQIEVSYRPRSWQSMADALSQALLANQRLRTENAALTEEGFLLREQLSQPTGLCGAFASGQLSYFRGIAARTMDTSNSSSGELEVVTITSYRGNTNIAVEVRLKHQTPEPWSLETATLVNEQGKMLRALRYRQAHALKSGEVGVVFVEFEPSVDLALDTATLRLTGTDGRAVTLIHVVFP